MFKKIAKIGKIIGLSTSIYLAIDIPFVLWCYRNDPRAQGLSFGEWIDLATGGGFADYGSYLCNIIYNRFKKES